MALSVVGTFRNFALNGADVTLTPPTLLENDIVLIGGGFTKASVQPGVSTAGFTSLRDDTSGAYRGRLMRKVQGASPDTSFTGIGSGDVLDGASYIGIVLRGGDTTTPEDAATIAVTSGTNNPNPGSITTVTAGACVIVITTGTGIDVAGVAISGYTITTGLAANDTRDSTCNMARKENKTPAGAEDPAAWTGFTIGDSVTWTIAVRPDTGAAVLVPWLDATGFMDPPTNYIYPLHSHYLHAWKSWAEPRKAITLKNGLGINVHWDNYVSLANPTGLCTALLAAGIRNIRVSVGWNKLDRATNTLTGTNLAHFQGLVTAATGLGIRLTICVQCHHGEPNPPLNVTRTVTASAALSAATVTLNDVTGLTPHFSGLNSLTDNIYCEVIFTAINTGTKVCTLSKPLPLAIAASTSVQVGTFLYRPFTEPGHAEYNDTTAGWLNYVRAMCNATIAAGATAFDIEIWNELSFGSNYLFHETYYDPPLFTVSVDNPLNPGERIYEIGRETVEMLTAEYPTVRAIWGFSNTNFFGTAIPDLPTLTAGQTYHPYQFLFYDNIADENFAENHEGYAPTAPPYVVYMPECVLTWMKTETLVHVLQLPTRLTNLSPGSTTFLHYQTEQGTAPSEWGVATQAEGDRVKATYLLRAIVASLHRGTDVLHMFVDVWATGQTALQRALAFGLFTDAYATTPPIDAVARLMALVQEAQDIASPTALTYDVSLSPNDAAFAGDGGSNPDLTNREVLAVFPFQMSATDWMIPVYVMTRNVLAASMTPVTATIRFNGLNGTGIASATAKDLLTGSSVSVTTVESLVGSLTVSFLVSESPVALILAGAAGGGQPVRTLYQMRHRRVG